MNVVLIPFFLAARVAVNTPWQYGPEYVFDVEVNSTAILQEDPRFSNRLTIRSKLICQPKQTDKLSCHFRDSTASSFLSKIPDPRVPAHPISPTRPQVAYEMKDDQFELEFTEKGLQGLIVNENIQPRELDMKRVIVDQLNMGTVPSIRTREDFGPMENFTLGECTTGLIINRFGLVPDLQRKRNYVLESTAELQDGQVVVIRKSRQLNVCTHKTPYFFGSAESYREVGDFTSEVTSSENSIVMTTTDFSANTWNVIKTSKPIDEMVTTLYEGIRLTLKSIHPAKSEPPEVKDPARASIFIGRWLIDESSEENF